MKTTIFKRTMGLFVAAVMSFSGVSSAIADEYASTEVSAEIDFDAASDYWGSGNERNDLNYDDFEADDEMLSIISDKNQLLMQRSTYPTSYSLGITWQQQINSYYCGPATASMILSLTTAGTPTQAQIAASTYLGTTSSGTPWFSGGADATASPDYYNMMRGLNKWQYNRNGRYDWQYTVYPYNTVATDSGYVERIKSTIYMDYAVAINGHSDASSTAENHIPGYPNIEVGHWLVCYGWSGSNYYFADPAAGIAGFENVSSKYPVTQSKMLAFISNGIVY